MSKVDEVTKYGSWEKDRVLGCGGFGIVTLWKNIDDNRYIALKKCRWDSFANGSDMITKKQKDRWSNEVEIMKRLSHRNVVKSVPLPNEFRTMKSELPILSMEFCSLGDLRQILNKPENCCGLQEREVRRIITDIKNAVAYLHSEKITHRDLKPENIVLKPDKDTPGGVIYKLIDLGYAKELDQSSICNSFVGTLQYLAPELFLNSVYTSTVDYWSLGLVSHEIITGVRPFLPNMPPAQWMIHVEKKSSDVICAYQRIEDESIVFQKELFKENHISDYLKLQLEKWLMVALEWNPDKRGKNNGELVIFNMLDVIFAKKIVSVFCVKLYKILSYEVDSATAVSTLKKWIDRDTRLPVDSQLLLLPSGEELSDEKLAVDCWDRMNYDIMLYVFPATGFTLPRDIKPFCPEPVAFLLKNTKEKDTVEFSIKRRICASAVYFIYQEFYLYKCFLDAYDIKIIWLVSFDAKLGKMFQEICAKLERLKAVCNFGAESLKCDKKCFDNPIVSSLLKNIPQLRQSFGHYEQVIIQQSQNFKSESDMQIKFDKGVDDLEKKIGSIRSIIAQLLKFHDQNVSCTKLSEIKNALKGSYRIYANLMNSKKIDQMQVTGSKEASDLPMKAMLKQVYKFLKVRDDALTDADFAAHLRKLDACELEMKSIQNDLHSLIEDITNSLSRVMSVQTKRQQEFWVLVMALSRNYIQLQQQPIVQSIPSSPSEFLAAENLQSDLRQLKINQVTSAIKNFDLNQPSTVNTDPHSSSPKVSVNGFRNNGPLNNPPIVSYIRQNSSNISSANSNAFTPAVNMASSSLFPNSDSMDTRSILDENESIRSAIMEGLSEAHDRMQFIISEANSVDWNSLLQSSEEYLSN